MRKMPNSFEASNLNLSMCICEHCNILVSLVGFHVIAPFGPGKEERLFLYKFYHHGDNDSTKQLFCSYSTCIFVPWIIQKHFLFFFMFYWRIFASHSLIYNTYQSLLNSHLFSDRFLGGILFAVTLALKILGFLQAHHQP